VSVNEGKKGNLPFSAQKVIKKKEDVGNQKKIVRAVSFRTTVLGSSGGDLGLGFRSRGKVKNRMTV